MGSDDEDSITLAINTSTPLTEEDVAERQNAYRLYRKGKSSETEIDLMTFFGIVRGAILSVDTTFLEALDLQDLFRLLDEMDKHLKDSDFRISGELSHDVDAYKLFITSHTQAAVPASNPKWQHVADHLRLEAFKRLVAPTNIQSYGVYADPDDPWACKTYYQRAMLAVGLDLIADALLTFDRFVLLMHLWSCPWRTYPLFRMLGLSLVLPVMEVSINLSRDLWRRCVVLRCILI